MARDKPDGRERREGRARDRGRERADDHDDRDGGDLRERLRAVETLATDTAHLASTSAFRFGGYTAQKGLVYFVSGDLKERLSRRWTDWKRTASLEPSQRPTAKPRPWKLQIYDALVEWVVGAVANGPTGADRGTIAGLLETITGGGVSVEAANHGDPLDGKPWPVIITYRGSEDSQEVKDAWLAEALRGYLGPGKELGVRPARYLPGAHKRVLEHLPNKGGRKAGQRRSPKRESEHRGGSERGKHPRVGA